MNSRVFLCTLCTLLIGCCSNSLAINGMPMHEQQSDIHNIDGRLKKYASSNRIEPTKPSFYYYGQSSKKQQQKKHANIVRRQKSPLGRIIDILD